MNERVFEWRWGNKKWDSFLQAIRELWLTFLSRIGNPILNEIGQNQETPSCVGFDLNGEKRGDKGPTRATLLEGMSHL